MTRKPVLGLAVLPLLAALAIQPARADGLEDWINDCKGEPGASVITACTQAIASGRVQDGGTLVRLLTDRAESYMLEGQFALAIADCDRALVLAPGDDDALYLRARANGKAGNLDAALADYDGLIARRPADYFFYEARAIAYGDAGRFDRALADFDQALRLAPGMPKPFIERIDLTVAMGRYDLAMTALDTAIRRWPHNGYFLLVRAEAYARWTAGPPDRLARARKDIDAAIALTPDDPELYAARARLEDLQGDGAAAAADRKRAQARAPH